ncbi:unnamed protein product [Candidula unifasciata]|uniref:PIF1/LRR1 pleckstrin homology domain-containing protein n=1 Tax=Candidula unifasciata TaxID=100452 RepID=A0A8S3ZDB4_9EUPU|nr:unnamed protein product [Candidula unifasciata]
MRLTCEVHITNRLLPTLNIRKPVRSTFTQVSIGQKPGGQNKAGQVFLMLCTAKNRNGTKYLLHSNVAQIFGRFIREGKATVSFLNPADDISFSKADPVRLMAFMKLLRLACQGKDFPADSLSILVPASGREIEKPVTSLKVEKPSEYPMTFPKSLQQLIIKNCSLKKMSAQISALQELRLLDMSCNCLSSVPETLCQLTNLHTLNLAQNKLTTFPVSLINSSISKCLVNLDLKNNEITSIPADIVKLKSLHSLNISHNQLRHIPESLGFMKTLRDVYLSNNLLEFLPGTMLSKWYNAIDFSSNPFPDERTVARQLNPVLPVPTLAELAARSVVKYRVPYSAEDLDWYSISYLKTARFCLCGKPCFEAKSTQIVWMMVASNVLYNEQQAPYLVNFCSRTCILRL